MAAAEYEGAVGPKDGDRGAMLAVAAFICDCAAVLPAIADVTASGAAGFGPAGGFSDLLECSKEHLRSCTFLHSDSSATAGCNYKGMRQRGGVGGRK